MLDRAVSVGIGFKVAMFRNKTRSWNIDLVRRVWIPSEILTDLPTVQNWECEISGVKWFAVVNDASLDSDSSRSRTTLHCVLRLQKNTCRVLLAAPPAGLGRRFSSDAPLASLILGWLLGLSGLLHRRLCSRGGSRLLSGAVRRRRLDLRGGGSCHHLLLDDLLLHHLGCGCPCRNHLHLSGGGGGCLGQSHRLRLGLDLKTNKQYRVVSCLTSGWTITPKLVSW